MCLCVGGEKLDTRARARAHTHGGRKRRRGIKVGEVETERERVCKHNINVTMFHDHQLHDVNTCTTINNLLTYWELEVTVSISVTSERQHRKRHELMRYHRHLTAYKRPSLLGCLPLSSLPQSPRHNSANVIYSFCGAFKWKFCWRVVSSPPNPKPEGTGSFVSEFHTLVGRAQF